MSEPVIAGARPLPLLAPWLNWVLGHPGPRGAVVMMIELAGAAPLSAGPGRRRSEGGMIR